MANPQLENGHFLIANDLWDAVCSIRIPGEARQVLDSIIRKTYGWHKKEDEISLSQFKEMTGLSSVHIIRARGKLLSMNIIVVTQKGNRGNLTYSVQKDYSKWRALPKKVIVTQKGNKALPKKVHTKDKEQKTRRTMSPNPVDEKLTNLLIELILKNNPTARVKNITSNARATWVDSCRLMREEDKRTIGDIERVLRFSQLDEFWKANILSMPKLRKQFDQLYMREKTTKKELTEEEKMREHYEKNLKPRR